MYDTTFFVRFLIDDIRINTEEDSRDKYFNKRKIEKIDKIIIVENKNCGLLKRHSHQNNSFNFTRSLCEIFFDPPLYKTLGILQIVSQYYKLITQYYNPINNTYNRQARIIIFQKNVSFEETVFFADLIVYP